MTVASKSEAGSKTESVSNPEASSDEAAPAHHVGRRLRQLQDLPVDVLEKLKPRKAKSLNDWGVNSVFDLLTTYPRRYIDRTQKVDVADLAVGDEAVVMAEVRQMKARRDRRGKVRVELEVADYSGGLKVVFFNQAWRERQLPEGSEVLLWGKLTEYKGTRQMVNPVVDLVVAVGDDEVDHRRRTLRIVPVYPASAKVGLSSWELGTWIVEALERAGQLADPLQDALRQDLRLMTRTEAMSKIHLPESMQEAQLARRRLAFDELLRLQLPLVMRRRSFDRDSKAIRHEVSGELVEELVANLSFELTQAQRRAIEEIFTDMASALPMHRLLQGDVGAGKTVVAVAAALAAAQGGHQAALMAPTEVLAEQHYLSISDLTKGLSLADPWRLEGSRPFSLAVLTSRTPASERSRILAGLAQGDVDLVVGTHALLTDDVRFSSLGLAVIDEQHRFGVEQRALLRAKGRAGPQGSDPDEGSGADPDLLVMTATPIPRTAAMVVFGDLDTTVLDELPLGRAPVDTVWVHDELGEQVVWDRVREEVEAGHRAYIVCPLVEESERVAARSATEEHGRLSEEIFPELKLGLLHGQMAPAEKEAVMSAFRTGEIEVLVATTVIEVGVDVPEATVMVVEDAGRFGIAQLHQLRGRVGRSSLPSWCYLLGQDLTPDGSKRLEALVATTDGFELAEQDLELRGAGTILGSRQKGRTDLCLASLRRDRDLVLLAKEVAATITEDDPLLDAHPLLKDEVRLFLDDEEEAFLFKS